MDLSPLTARLGHGIYTVARRAVPAGSQEMALITRYPIWLGISLP